MSQPNFPSPSLGGERMVMRHLTISVPLLLKVALYQRFPPRSGFFIKEESLLISCKSPGHKSLTALFDPSTIPSPPFLF